MRQGIVASFGTPDQILLMAREAEEHGWDGFFTWDGISVMPVDTWDPFSILAAAATHTDRIILGAMVFAMPRRLPWEFARQALTIDHLSGGRLVLPVGLGAVDDRAFSGVKGQTLDVKARAQTLDESLAFLKRSWSGNEFDFDGDHISVSGMQFLPRPVRGHIPVWPVAAWPAPRSMARAARWDGVIPQLLADRAFDTPTPLEVRDIKTWVESHRTPQSSPAHDVVLQGALPADRSQATQRLAAWSDAGATWWIESHWDPQTTTPGTLLELIRRGPVPLPTPNRP